MDRLREVSRRGSLSTGAQISTLRRPRSSGGFKDPAEEDEVMEDLHSSRLRERPRKEGISHSVARHKRTRHSSRELHSRVEDVEDAEAGEGGPSDEDDIPISPNLLPRKPTKLRFHGKVASDEVVAVEIPAVPRKARTAISKRPHEGNHGDGPRHQVFASASPPSTTVVPSHMPLGSSLKPMKRMKHTSTKFKVVKHTKVSTPVTISQQEVEVAEALFDLARMVSNLGSPGRNDEKMEVQTENSELRGAARPSSPEGTPPRRQDSVSTPQTSHSAVSSPVRGPIPVTSSHLSSTDVPTKRSTLIKMKAEDGAISQPKDDTNGRVSYFKSVGDSCTGQSVGSNTPADIKLNVTMKTGQGSHQKASLSSSLLPLPRQSSVVADSNILLKEAKGSSSPKIPLEHIVGSENYLKSDALHLTEFTEQKLQAGMGHSPQDACDSSALVKDKTTKATLSCKYEIDLMASPNVSASGASEKTGNSVDSGLVSCKRTQDQVKDPLQANQNYPSQFCLNTLSVKEEKMSTGNEKEARLGSMPKEEPFKAETLKQGERENQFEDVLKQEASHSHLGSQPNVVHPHPASGSGWPGSLPPMGYYPAAAAAAAAAAAVAAACPATGSVIGQLSTEEKGHPSLLVPPFTFPGARALCKRCATHVYIAHFIDTQQQMQRHPIWAAAYRNGASGSLYPMKSYNPNAPHLPPNVLFAGGLTGLTGLTVNNSPVNKGLCSELGPQNDNGPSYENVDGSVRMGSSQTLQVDTKNQTMSAEAGLGSTSGYSAAAHSSPSLEGHRGVSGGGTNAVGACPDLAGVSTGAAANPPSVTTTAAQVQYLQAIIQQAGFPFPFSPGHLVLPTQGHLAQQQQATIPFFNNLFYNPPFIHPQQTPATVKVPPKTSSVQGQSTSMHRDVRVGQSVSQQQQQFSSASSSHSHQRAASQHLQHYGETEMNLGGETVSSAESKFPRNMHTQEFSNMPASNIATASSSLNSAGISVLPPQVSLAAKQMSNMKLPQSGQTPQQSPSSTPYHYSSGSKSIDFQSPQASSGVQMGGTSKNMVGPGPLGFASVAAVMAPQGHAVLQTMSDSQLSHSQAYQESYAKHTSNHNLDGPRAASGFGMPEDKRLAAVKQGGPLKMDKESEGVAQGSSGYKTGLSSATLSGTSFNFMNAPVGNSSSRQAAPVSIGAVPSSGVGRANPNPNIIATASEPITSSRAPSPSLLFHVPNVTPNQGMRQGQISSQYSSQAKSASRMQVGTTGVATPPSTLLPGSYAGVPVVKQQSYPSKSHQVSVSSMQSRFPPTVSSSSGASVSPATAVSKASGSATTKNTAAGKGSYNSLQKQNSASPAKKTDVIVTHLPGQVMGPSSIAVNMGQSQPQHQQSQLQQMQHVIRQPPQQQHWQQQQKQGLHQEHSQQAAPQSMHQQFHVTGVPPAVSLQYHQAMGSNQAAQGGVHKQSASPHQAKHHRPYLEQHLYQPQQQQHSLSTESQQSARITTQPQQQHSALQNVVPATNRSVQQLSDSQPNKQQVASGPHQQPLSFASFGAISNAAAHTPVSFSVGSGGGRPASSDGNFNRVPSPTASTSMKPPGGISVGGAPNIQWSSTSSMGISHFQSVGGAKVAEAKLSPQSSGTISYLPYLQSATFSGGMVSGEKVVGASGVHAQSSASMMSMRDGMAGAGHENVSSHQYDNNRMSPASKAPAMGGNSTSTVKCPVSLPASPCVAPLALHGLTTPGQSSQTCTVIPATMAADSVSTTG
ncbi:hypothetical protein GOP47_0009308 [Adiantum capillus-veneris]|uniref:Uncharacterized protein n=1 Tax=Adiantum capillus-veneris TaxID=13818 RepID=A0A9D4ZIK2_ADICA|nr:hypothetical protein GOP47_0009308 [Adiantum capillus-veneris]